MTCCFSKKYIWTAAVFLHLCVSAIAQMKPDSVYFDNGSLKAIGFTKDALQDSAWIYYDQSGQIQRKGIYKSGLKTGKRNYCVPSPSNGVFVSFQIGCHSRQSFWKSSQCKYAVGHRYS